MEKKSRARRYRSFISHLHSTFEGPASVSGFCHEAARHGIDFIWLSDHDTRILSCAGPLGADRLPLAGAAGPDGDQPLWWEKTAGDADGAAAVAETADGRPRVSVAGKGDDWSGLTLSLRSRRKQQNRPLLGKPRLRLQLDSPLTPTERDARLVITITLSQAPPEHETAVLRYCLGNRDGLAAARPPETADGWLEIDLAADARRQGLAPDHTFRELDIRLEARRGGTAAATLGGLRIEPAVNCPETLFRAQAETARQVGDRYGVGVLAGYEVSGAARHMNCYGHLTPLVRYEAGGAGEDRRPSLEAIAQHAAAHGAVLSLNHPFSRYKREQMDETQRLAAVGEQAAEIIARRAYGARLVEVGFPLGRHGFSTEHYLRLWDTLNLAGLRLAGIAVSDAHSNIPWEEGNNFANYAPVNGADPAGLSAALGRGDFFMADPARFRGTFELATDRGRTMGQAQAGGTVTAVITGLPPGSRLDWVVDGRTDGGVSETGGRCRAAANLDRMRFFARAQVTAADGRLLLLANPVWAMTPGKGNGSKPEKQDTAT